MLLLYLCLPVTVQILHCLINVGKRVDEVDALAYRPNSVQGSRVSIKMAGNWNGDVEITEILTCRK